MSDQNSNDRKNDYSFSRMTRGEQIAKEKVISENADGTFSVPSQTVEEIVYLVRLIDGKYVCNCLDFKYHEERKIDACKHIHAVKFWIAAQVEIQQKPKPKVFADDSIQCPKCGSIRVVKFGHDSGKQVFKCRDCPHKFRELSLLKKAQYTPETVSLCLDLYFSGMSLRKIARTLSDQFDMNIGHTTILSWIQKYIPKISEYVNSLAPSELSDTWHADEVFQHMKGGVVVKQQKKKVAFLWQVMDRKTRFMLASKLSRFRDVNGATQAFNTALANAHGQKPENVFTDAWRAYKEGIAQTLGKVNHVAKCGIAKPHANNNRIERVNQTVRERTKVQRGWKSMNTQIPEGYRIQYNFVKPHMALEGMTPAQRARINGDKKANWLELLEQAMNKA